MANAQTLSTWDEIKIQRFGKETLFQSTENKPLQGIYKIANKQGAYSEIHFNNGKIDGTRTDYNAKDQVICEKPYKNGKPDGEWKYYDENGEVKTTESYKNGYKHGKWTKKIFSNNTYYIKTAYYEQDNPTGTWTEKWQNGDLKEERTYKGKGTYTAKEYHYNGKLQQVKSYNNFKLNGTQQLYSSSGILIKQEVYKNDVLEKKETFFDNGRPYEIYRFKDGRAHGKFINYKRSGAKSLEGFYENGSETGVWKKYRGDSGWLYFETTYKDDTENGMHKTYYPSGKVKKEGNYLKGSKNGKWKFYNETGKLIKEIEYDRGTEISRKELSAS